MPENKDNNKTNKIDESTLDFNKREKPDSQRMWKNRFYINLHVRESVPELIRLVQPRGIEMLMHGFNKHKNRLAEGTLVTVYCNDQNPNVLCQRYKDELMEFVNKKLHVIRDNPYELKGFKTKTKIITKINNEEVANKAFNLDHDEEGNIVGQV
jgi:hypothetical protein